MSSLDTGGPISPSVLLLSPSNGRGGGIERYVETLEWAFRARGVSSTRFSLRKPGLAGHLQLLGQASAHCRRAPAGRVRIVVAHRALLPVALILRARHQTGGISVLCHGSDVWGRELSVRWHLEMRAMRSPQVRVVAVSSFTAGAVNVAGRATVLSPGLSRQWFDDLVRARAKADGRCDDSVKLVTAFRLGDWRDKGLPELLSAVELLDHPGLVLTICGSGPVPAELQALARGLAWCDIRANLSDADLAETLAEADLFVLATRTRPGRRPCGEGFGLVLLEAQLAGTPVVAPARGGCRDAYIEGVTGNAPLDESADALAQTLGEMLKDLQGLADMGVAAARWARTRYDPDLYAMQAADRLL